MEERKGTGQQQDPTTFITCRLSVYRGTIPRILNTRMYIGIKYMNVVVVVRVQSVGREESRCG